MGRAAAVGTARDWQWPMRAVLDAAVSDEPQVPERGRSSRLLRVSLIAALVVLVGLWGYALTYSMTRRDPERFTADERAAVRNACEDAATRLRALPPVEAPPTNASVAARAESETEEFEQMVAELRDLRPQRADAATALHEWLDDWDQLLAARRAYASQVKTDKSAKIEVPVEGGSPIFVRMNNYAEGKGVVECKTDALGAERVYAFRKD
jgi:hypothetical protein